MDKESSYEREEEFDDIDYVEVQESGSTVAEHDDDESSRQ